MKIFFSLDFLQFINSITKLSSFFNIYFKFDFCLEKYILIIVTSRWGGSGVFGRKATLNPLYEGTWNSPRGQRSFCFIFILKRFDGLVLRGALPMNLVRVGTQQQ